MSVGSVNSQNNPPLILSENKTIKTTITSKIHYVVQKFFALLSDAYDTLQILLKKINVTLPASDKVSAMLDPVRQWFPFFFPSAQDISPKNTTEPKTTEEKTTEEKTTDKVIDVIDEFYVVDNQRNSLDGSAAKTEDGSLAKSESVSVEKTDEIQIETETTDQKVTETASKTLEEIKENDSEKLEVSQPVEEELSIPPALKGKAVFNNIGIKGLRNLIKTLTHRFNPPTSEVSAEPDSKVSSSNGDAIPLSSTSSSNRLDCEMIKSRPTPKKSIRIKEGSRRRGKDIFKSLDELKSESPSIPVKYSDTTPEESNKEVEVLSKEEQKKKLNLLLARSPQKLNVK